MIGAILLTLAVAAPAAAAERTYGLTSFDRIRVEGPFRVTVTKGQSLSARAVGSPGALDRISVKLEGRTLTIRPDTSVWGGYPGQQIAPATVNVTAPELSSAILLGSGSLDIGRMSGLHVMLTVEGAGRLKVGNVAADNLSLGLLGSGSVDVAGTAKTATVTVRGAAEIHADQLDVADLTLTTESAGTVAMRATRSAKVTASGMGETRVEGKAACTVSRLGVGPVSCGRGSHQSEGS